MKKAQSNNHSYSLIPGLIIVLFMTISLVMADKLVILSPHSQSHRQEIGDAFQDYYLKTYKTPVQVEWLDQGGGTDILRYIQSEYKRKSSGIGADLMYGGGIDPYMELAKLGYLQPYKVSAALLKKIPAQLHGVPIYDKKYQWYGTALAGFGILRNDAVIRRLHLPYAKTWTDLTDPRLMGWVGSADPRHSGSVHMMYEIILQAYGWDKGWDIITRMGANIKSFTQAASSTPAEVKSGNAAYGLCIDTYAWAQIAEVGRAQMSFVLPTGVTVINPDAIGILKGAPNQKAAKAFLEFVVSDKAQKILMLPPKSPEGPKQFALYRMSILPEVYKTLGTQANIPVNPYQGGSLLKYDAAKGSKRYVIVNDLVGALIIDSHKELVDAVKRGAGKSAGSKLGVPPITEQQALQYADSIASNPQLRNKLIADWTVFARNKYSGTAK